VPDAGWLTPPHARKEVKRFGDVRKHNYSQADHVEYLQNPPYRDHSWFHFDSLCARGFLSLCVSIRGPPFHRTERKLLPAKDGGVLRTVKDARPPVL
jgi:hypothetical protein